MQTLTCPIPNNINPLQSNGFMFAINKLPEVTFFCQEVEIPSMSLPAAQAATPLSDLFMSGDKIEFSELNITFLIDENMNNYKAIYDWMVGLGKPADTEQYAAFMRRDVMALGDATRSSSDGVLQVLGSSNNQVRVVTFRDLVPVALQSLQLQSTTTDTQYLAGSATFRYTLYEFA